MNQIGLRFRDPDTGSSKGDTIELDRILAGLRRQIWPIGVSAVAGLVLGVFYLATTPSTYFASSTILVDTVGNKIVEEVSAFEARVQSDAVLLNEIEIIRSQQIARIVAEDLRLHENEVFLNPPSSLLSQMIGGAKGAVRALLPGGSSPAVNGPELTPTEREAQEIAVAARSLQRQIFVQRFGQSYVFMIGFGAHDPGLAKDITNAYAEAYLADQLNANFDATERTTAWLQDRLAALAASSQEASRAVEVFRAENNLSASEGRLMTEQNLAQLNTELANAVAENARAEALASQYSAVLEAGPGDGMVQRVLSLDATNDLRLAEIQDRISALSSRLQQIEEDFGVDHPQAVMVRAQLQEEGQAAFREATRLSQRYAGDQATAAAREAALRATVSAASTVNAEASTLQVELRGLEQRAEALTTLYQSYLSRFEEIDQQKSFPVPTARILSQAELPRSASSPSTTRVLAVMLIFGLMAGAAIALIREYRDRFFRTGDDVLAATGLPFLGYLPHLTKGARRSIFKRHKAPGEPGTIKPTAPGQIEFHAVKHPRSQYSETLRNARIAIDSSLPGKKHRIIGLSSILPEEGKTTVSLNLAGLLASSGQSTLLIDADLRNPGLTRFTKVSGGMGLVDAILGNVSWQKTRLQIGNPKLHFVPCTTQAFVSHTSDLLGSAAMKTLLTEAAEAYDYVIVDLPPLGPVVDARAILPHLDRILMVAEWGRTPKGLVRQVLAAEPLVADKAVGMMLNKVDLGALPDYSPPTGSERYFSEYSKYYSGAA